MIIQLADRIVLSPYAAKRLALFVNNVIRDYESRYGTPDVELRRPAEPPTP